MGIHTENFQWKVADDNDVWIIEVASRLCASCKEMKPEFAKVAKDEKAFKFGVMYMEDRGTAQLAAKFEGVLDAGLPSVIMLHDKADPYSFVSLVEGDAVKAARLKTLIHKAAKDAKLTKAPDGHFVKIGGEKRGEL